MTYAEELRNEGEQRAQQKLMTYAEELRKEGEQRAQQKIMTYAEELRKEGEQRGIQLGEQKAQQEIAKQLLESGVDNSIVAAATHLTEDQIKSLK